MQTTVKNLHGMHLQTCLCGSSEGLREGVRLAYKTTKAILTSPLESGRAFYQMINDLDKVAEEVWQKLISQEWLLPNGSTGRLTAAERTAVHCEVFGEMLLGGGVSKAVLDVLVKRSFLQNMPNAVKNQLKFRTQNGNQLELLADEALEKVKGNLNSPTKYDVVRGEKDFAHFRTVSLVDENGPIYPQGHNYELINNPTDFNQNLRDLFKKLVFDSDK